MARTGLALQRRPLIGDAWLVRQNSEILHGVVPNTLNDSYSQLQFDPNLGLWDRSVDGRREFQANTFITHLSEIRCPRKWTWISSRQQRPCHLVHIVDNLFLQLESQRTRYRRQLLSKFNRVDFLRFCMQATTSEKSWSCVLQAAWWTRCSQRKRRPMKFYHWMKRMSLQD